MPWGCMLLAGKAAGHCPATQQLRIRHFQSLILAQKGNDFFAGTYMGSKDSIKDAFFTMVASLSAAGERTI